MNKKSQNHIDCGTALEWIHLLLDKELPPPDHQKLQAHLQGCPNCSTALRELSLIENAHGALDRSLDTVASGYFEELPDRVMARLALAEKRAARSFSLPKPQLPKLQVPAGWQQVIFGRGKYVLAFAAVMLLTFIITRQLRQDFFSSTLRFEKSPENPAQLVLEKPDLPEEKARRELSEAPEAPASRADNSAAVTDEPPVAQATPPPPEQELPASLAGRAQADSKPEPKAVQQVKMAALPAREAEADLAHIEGQDTGGAAALQPSSVDVPGQQRALSRQNTAGAGVATQSSIKSYAPAQSEPAKMKPQLGHSAALMLESDFERATSQARQAVSEQSRRKIWQEFLHTKPDSVHYHLAVVEISRSFAAEIDSASTPAQIEEAIQFYNTMEPVLSAHGNRETYARERGRLESLLRWKQMH